MELVKNNIFKFLGVTTDQVVAEYIKRHSPVHPGVDWRINYVTIDKQGTGDTNNQTRPIGEEGDNNQTGSANSFSSFVSMILLPALALILAR